MAMPEPFDPYRKWLGIPQENQPPTHYQLLGIPEGEGDPDVIENAANRQMAHVRTFQSGKHSKLSQEILNQLASAKRVLLTPGKKAEYDAQLVASLPPAPPPSPTTAASQPASTSSPTETSIHLRGSSRKSIRRRRRQRKSSSLPLLLGIIALAIAIGLIALLANRQRRDRAHRDLFTAPVERLIGNVSGLSLPT